MNNFHSKSIAEVFEILDAGPNGLVTETVINKRSRFGYNELLATKGPGQLQIFLSQFADFLVIILLIAGVVSLLLQDRESAIVIFAVTVLNAWLGMTQHLKAGEALKSLKSMTAPVARVLRNTIKAEIPSRELVPGDILYLEAGDYVCADARIIDNVSLQVNESALTGESLSVSKSTQILKETEVPLGDRKNMVFTGSLITYGRATAIITATGMNTELGNIAMLLAATPEKKRRFKQISTPLGKN